MGTPDPLYSPTAQIRRILQERGLTYADLARMSGVNKNRVYRVVKNDLSEPRTAEVIIFAKTLGVTPPDLYEPMEEAA